MAARHAALATLRAMGDPEADLGPGGPIVDDPTPLIARAAAPKPVG